MTACGFEDLHADSGVAKEAVCPAPLPLHNPSGNKQTLV